MTRSRTALFCLMAFVGLAHRTERPCVAAFDDALAEIRLTLDAPAGQVAVHSWVSPGKGSVRLVGDIRKLSGDTHGTAEIVRDGQTIWTRRFESTDSIRHGLDVTVHDLDPHSRVDLRITAGGRPLRMAVALSVVPEPFVSRWAAHLPAGYPTWTEDKKAVLRKKGQDSLQAIRQASADTQGRIVIPPGDYLFQANWSRASTLRDLADLEIVAEGVTFWFEPPMVHALQFENCRNVTVRGLSIDFTIPCWFQARVSDVDREMKTIRADVMADYEPRTAKGEVEADGHRALMFYDADGRFINHRHSPGAWQLTEDGGSLVCRDIGLAGIPASLKPGDHVVGAIRTGAALRSKSCDRMRFEDITIWSSPGVAVYEGGGAGGHIYRRVRATRRPHTNRLHAFGADIFHLADTDRGPTLDRCELAYGSDDNLNIHGSFGRVVQRVDHRRYHLDGPYQAGDRIEFRDAGSVTLLGDATVVSVTETPDGPTLPITDMYLAKGHVLVELDRPLELPPLSLVLLDGKRSAGGFILRNCWLHDNFQRTLINGSPGGLIESNTLQNVGHGLTIQFETWGPWMEGPFARDLVIRDNRFINAPPDGAAISVSMHPPGGGSHRRRFEATPVTDMTITGNTFSRTSTAPLVIHNVDGLTIHGNSIDYPADPPKPTGRGNASEVNWLLLQDCSRVSLERNQSFGAPAK